MKKIIILILTIGILSSCSNDDDISTNNEIIGKWKLIEAKIFDFGGQSSTDYSNENIIYNFQSNGILKVTGEQNAGYPTGEYEYFFGEDYLGGTTDPKVLLVKINDSKWTYNLTNRKMKLGQSYVDGPDLILERK